jgi:Rrf2 family protein
VVYCCYNYNAKKIAVKIHYVNRVYEDLARQYRFSRLRSGLIGLGVILDKTYRDYYNTKDMRLSLRGEYALRALMALAENYTDKVVSIQVISDQEAIPKRFLEQILNDLKSGGFVESKRGIAGGYRLARRPEDISLAPVLRYIEGGLVGGASATHKTSPQWSGTDEAHSAIHSVMKEVREAILRVLQGLSIADLCERARQLRADHASVPDYAI